MPSPFVDPVCPLKGGPCRHASEMKIPRVERVIDMNERAVKKTVRYDNKGIHCNNDGRHLVADLET